MRKAVCAAWTGLVLSALLVSPSSARVPRLAELRSTTVVTATQSGWVDVVVPVDARLSPAGERNPDVAISGAGRFVSVSLTRLDDSSAPDFLTSYRLPAFLTGQQRTEGSTYPQPRCTGFPSEAVPARQDCTFPTPQYVLLHEGTYRLLVVTDGSPLRVTLRLRGLDKGTQQVRPTELLRSEQRPLPRREAYADKLLTFGAKGSFGGARVYGWVMAQVKGSSKPLLREASTCARVDAGDPPPLGFGPHCPQGRGGGYSLELNLGGQNYGLFGGFVSSDSRQGPLALGGSIGNSDGAVLGQTLGVWLELP